MTISTDGREITVTINVSEAAMVTAAFALAREEVTVGAAMDGSLGQMCRLMMDVIDPMNNALMEFIVVMGGEGLGPIFSELDGARQELDSPLYRMALERTAQRLQEAQRLLEGQS